MIIKQGVSENQWVIKLNEDESIIFQGSNNEDGTPFVLVAYNNWEDPSKKFTKVIEFEKLNKVNVEYFQQIRTKERIKLLQEIKQFIDE